MYLDMYHWVERVRHDLETKAPRHTPVYLSIYLSITVMTLLLGRKVMTKLDGILKSKDITLLTKVCLIKTMFSSSHVRFKP